MKLCRTKIILPSGDSFITDINANLCMGQHFTINELANWSNKDDVKFIISPESIVFIQRMEEFRRWYGKPIIVNSNYRSASFNEGLEDAIKNSEHLRACALDWKVTGHTIIQRNAIKNQIFKQARSYGTGCHLIYYNWGYHIDFAGTSLLVLDYRH